MGIRMLCVTKKSHRASKIIVKRLGVFAFYTLSTALWQDVFFACRMWRGGTGWRDRQYERYTKSAGDALHATRLPPLRRSETGHARRPLRRAIHPSGDRH